MADVTYSAGGTTFTGEGINFYRMATLKVHMGSELRGFKLTRGPSVFKIVKKEFGLKGSKQEIYDQFVKLVEEKKAQLTVVNQ